MRALVYIAAALLCGCTGEVYYQCSTAIGGMGFEFAPDCDAARSNADLAVSMLGGAGISAAWTALTVVVQDGYRLRENGTTVTNETVIGNFSWDPQPSVTLARGGRALLHEMIHYWEMLHGVVDTGAHPDWCQKGYGIEQSCPDSLDWMFAQTASPMSP